MTTGWSGRRRVAAARLRRMDCVGEVSPSARVQAPVVLWLLDCCFRGGECADAQESGYL